MRIYKEEGISPLGCLGPLVIQMPIWISLYWCIYALIPTFPENFASLFHLFYQKCRVVSSKQEDSELTKARIKLVRCAKFVLGKSLSLMGMEAPETM